MSFLLTDLFGLHQPVPLVTDNASAFPFIFLTRTCATLVGCYCDFGAYALSVARTFVTFE
jgi:hypothetical protein